MNNELIELLKTLENIAAAEYSDYELAERASKAIQSLQEAEPVGADLPWDDLKVAFGIEHADTVWGADLKLPTGWELVETDCSGARCVAVFRVECIPSIADALEVSGALMEVKTND